jgi:uncharacterized protein
MDLPVPQATDTTRPFWDGLKQGRLVIQYSPSADQWVFYPRVLAPGTLADDLEWRQITGAEVDEGVHIPTELVGVEPDDVTIGMRVAPVFERAADGETVLLKFRPTR